MLYDLHDSHHSHVDGALTDWLPHTTVRHDRAYRIFLCCCESAASRLEGMITTGLRSRGAGVRVTHLRPLQGKGSSRARMVFAVRGPSEVRGAIAALINRLSADKQARAVRWESDPRSGS